MRNLSITVLGVCCMLFCLRSSSQTTHSSGKIPLNEPDNNKPKLFADLPDQIQFNPTDLSHLFGLKVGESVNVPISAEFTFSGQVVSKAEEAKSSSVVIRSTNRVGARLVFTKVTDADNSTRYIGRIISLQHGDSYEIVSENNQYYFKKKGLYDLMSE
jgi:hypothetical protein